MQLVTEAITQAEANQKTKLDPSQAIGHFSIHSSTINASEI